MPVLGSKLVYIQYKMKNDKHEWHVGNYHTLQNNGKIETTIKESGLRCWLGYIAGK